MMNEAARAALGRQVDEACTEGTEFEAVWDTVATAREAAPADAGLLRWQARLAEAGGLRQAHWQALCALVAIDPADRETVFEWACLQFRRADWLAADEAPDDEDDEDDEDDDQDGEDADAADDPAEAAQQARAAHLQAEAVDACLRLADQHGADAGFLQRLLGDDASPLRQRPWLRLRELLRATTRHRQPALDRLLALAWADLAGWLPDSWSQDQPQPMGFLQDDFGNLFDALLVERALNELSRALGSVSHDAELRAQRATLLAACGRHAEAADEHAACAVAWRAEAARWPGDDPGSAQARAEALAQADGADEQAALHRAGRDAVVQASMQGISQALAQWPGQGLAAGDGDDRLAALRQQFEAEVQPARQAVALGPSEAERAVLDADAARVAAGLGGLLAWDPVALQPLEAHALEAPLSLWLADIGAQLQALGWRHLGWCENPAYRAMFHCQVVTGLWADAAGTTVVAAAAAGRVQVVDVESELLSGQQLVTTSSRGRSNFGGGPGVDQLAVDDTLPLAEVVQLHQVRLAHGLARVPSAAARAIDSVASFAAMQERQRVGKLAWRLAEGISEFEALGVPVQFPGYFVPVLRAAVRRQIAAWRAERGG